MNGLGQKNSNISFFSCSIIDILFALAMFYFLNSVAKERSKYQDLPG